MKIEEIYDLKLKYQEVYDRTKDYTRNDFVIELIKKDDEKQELIEYLKEKKKAYTELYNKSRDIIDFDRYDSLNILCEEILSKIEKR